MNKETAKELAQKLANETGLNHIIYPTLMEDVWLCGEEGLHLSERGEHFKEVVYPEMTLRVYVWKGFAPDYTGGLAVAIAYSEAQAIKLVIKEHGYEPRPGEWGDLEVLELSPMAHTASGGG